MLYSMALGAGLRLTELRGLNVGDVSPDGRQVRRRVLLRTTTTKNGRRNGMKLAVYYRSRGKRKEALSRPREPLQSVAASHA